MKLFAAALLVFGVAPIPEQEPNNRITQAQFVGDLFKDGNDLRVKGLIRHSHDVDHYSYRVHEKTDLRMSVVTGAMKMPLIPGFSPGGGMTFAPWLHVIDSEGHVLVDKEGYSGNIFISKLHIERPTILYVRIISLGEAVYPKPGPDSYFLKVADSLQP